VLVSFLCLFVACLVACTRLEPVPQDAKELPQPATRETSFISISRGPGSLDAMWLPANDMISTQSVYINDISDFKS
jgi:hypothetical protein